MVRQQFHFVLGIAIWAAAGPAMAQTFQNNDFVTWSQVAWGQMPTSGNLTYELQQDFNTVFASTNDLMEIGIHGSAGYSIIFDDPNDIINFLPATGAPGPLTADLLDPATSAAGSYGGEVATLELNVAFNDAGLLKGNLGMSVGNLVLKGFTGDLTFANGLTVRQILSDANTVLGGGPEPNSSVTFQDMFTLANDIDMSFNNGTVSTFATQHFVYPVSQSAPEIDATAAGGAAMLLIGALAVARGRSRGGAFSGNQALAAASSSSPIRATTSPCA
jgi:hypothetical protein